MTPREPIWGQHSGHSPFSNVEFEFDFVLQTIDRDLVQKTGCPYGPLQRKGAFLDIKAGDEFVQHC